MAAEPRVLLDGIVFPEGPRWRQGRLWFSDMHARRVMTVTLEGRTETIVEHESDRLSGLGWLPDGQLLVVAMGSRKVLRMERGKLVEHADISSLATGDCNDMVVDGAGRAYVGNFGFDFNHGEEPKTTCIVRVDPNGTAEIAATGVLFPNGTVITPDGKTLIVGETLGHKLTAFDVGANGGLSHQRTWADVGEAVPDGICLDAENAIWVASPSTSEFLRVKEGGEVTDRIPVPGRGAYACMLGGEDRKTLFLCTAVGSNRDLREGTMKGAIEVVEVDVAGAGWP